MEYEEEFDFYKYNTTGILMGIAYVLVFWLIVLLAWPDDQKNKEEKENNTEDTCLTPPNTLE